jgi:CRP/FNR family nitrogen fixation transcriptional regulator
MLTWRMTSVPPRAARQPAANSVAKQQIHDIVAHFGAAIHVERDVEIFSDGDDALSAYLVTGGTVRACKLMRDGRRQIEAFYLPGDIFGLEDEETHSCSAEAVSSVHVLAMNKTALHSMAMQNPSVSHQLWKISSEHLLQANRHAQLLGRMHARERVVAFLLEMATRLGTNVAVELPMSRHDIADYLGLTIETVSRVLAKLEKLGIISIPVARSIVLSNLHALVGMNDESCGCTSVGIGASTDAGGASASRMRTHVSRDMPVAARRWPPASPALASGV